MAYTWDAEKLRDIRENLHRVNYSEGQPGLIGKADGTIYWTPSGGTARRDRVWVRIGGTEGATEIIAYCSGIPRQYNLPVIVASRGGIPTIIRTDLQRADAFADGKLLDIPEHAVTHGRFGNDALYVTGPAFLPLMAHPSNPLALTVTVEPGFYRYLTTETVFTTTTTGSFSSYLPAAGMQTFGVLSLNRSTNALLFTVSGLNAVSADTVPFTAAQVLTVVSTLADYHYPLCAIRLYSGQTVLRAPDIFMDLRLWGGEYVGSVPSTLDDLTDVAISAPATNNTLIYNGSSWVNAIPSNTFASGLIAPVVDTAKQDSTNGTYFPENTGASTTPSGWVQVDAAAATYVNAPVGFWTIGGTSGDTSWEYKKQTAYDFESVVASNAFKSYWIGPIILKDGLYSADVDYYLGVHADNSGAPSATKFVRLHIHYDQASDKWQIRGQYKDGTTLTSGTYYDLARMPLQPFWLRVALKNDTNKLVTVYAGATAFQQAHGAIVSGNASSSVTWGQAWIDFSMSRGTGGADTILIGGHDYSADS